MAKSLIAGLLIFAFVGVILISLQFIQHKRSIIVSQSSNNEGFKNNKSPTRAADCQCLPGYIPSKKKYGGNIYSLFNAYYFYNPSETQNIYFIDRDNTCGIEGMDTNNTMKYPDLLTFAEWNVIGSSFRGVLSCDMIKPNTTNVYFCQNLSDPTKSRKCY